MSPPEFGSFPSNETGSSRKNAVRGAHSIYFAEDPIACYRNRTYKNWGSSYKGSPPKIVCHRSPFPREAEPGTPFPPRGKRCVLRMRSAPARASFKTLAGVAYIQTKKKWDSPKKCALRVAFLSGLSLIVQFRDTKIGGLHISSPPDFCSSLRIM